jgi:hypothetical protein
MTAKTTIYTLRERNDQILLEKISWRPLVYTHPDREEKRKADWLELVIKMADVWPAGQIKWCSATIRFDDPEDIPLPAHQRARALSANPVR